MNEPLTVFVIDDDDAVRDSLSMLLQIEGLATRTFASAEQFLAASTPADRGCLILDVRLPGMSGPELQVEIMRRQLPLPIIFISGHGWIPSAAQAGSTGTVDFLSKPLNPDELIEHVRAALLRTNADAPP